MIPVIYSTTLIIEGAKAIEQAAAATSAAAPVPQTWMAVVYMIAVLLIGQAGLWIREIMKYKDFKNKNGALDEIKKQATKAAETSIEVKAMVGMMQTNCTATTSRFASEIQANTSRLIDHISKKD